MDPSSTSTHSENFQSLLQAGLPQNVAEKLDEIYMAGENTAMSCREVCVVMEAMWTVGVLLISTHCP